MNLESRQDKQDKRDGFISSQSILDFYRHRLLDNKAKLRVF